MREGREGVGETERGKKDEGGMKGGGEQWSERDREGGKKERREKGI